MKYVRDLKFVDQSAKIYIYLGSDSRRHVLIPLSCRATTLRARQKVVKNEICDGNRCDNSNGLLYVHTHTCSDDVASTCILARDIASGDKNFRSIIEEFINTASENEVMVRRKKL